MVFQSYLLVFLLAILRNIKFKYVSWVFKDFAAPAEIAFDVEVENQVISLKGLEIKASDVSQEHEVDRKGCPVLSDGKAESTEDGGDVGVRVHEKVFVVVGQELLD